MKNLLTLLFSAILISAQAQLDPFASVVNIGGNDVNLSQYDIVRIEVATIDDFYKFQANVVYGQSRKEEMRIYILGDVRYFNGPTDVLNFLAEKYEFTISQYWVNPETMVEVYILRMKGLKPAE